jgi:hypothetical protein
MIQRNCYTRVDVTAGRRQIADSSHCCSEVYWPRDAIVQVREEDAILSILHALLFVKRLYQLLINFIFQFGKWISYTDIYTQDANKFITEFLNPVDMG